MLKLYDSSHNPLGNLVKYKDCKKESEVATGDATISFTYLAKHHEIRNEYYIRTKDAEYTVKEVNEDSGGFPHIVAVLNLEDLQRESWESYSITDVTIAEAAKTLLERVGWSLGECSITKRRNAAMVQVTTLGIVQNLCMAFMCEPVFDNIHKTVSFYEERGEDKGVYFMQGLNLRKLDKQNNSYDYYTQIIPIGAEGLTIEGVNGGRKYLENYQYSRKILPYIWKDENYTDAQALMEDAALKLRDMSRPAVSYSADVIDLAKQSSRYSVLSYALGDRVTLIDRKTNTREAQRIMRMVEYEKDPKKNTCELGNTVLTFEELQERLEAAADLVGSTMTSDGKIHVSDILNWEKGLEDSETVGALQKRVSRVVAVSYDNTAPSNAESGDVWFDQSDGNKPSRYDGERWVEEQFGTSALRASAVTAEKIDVADLFAQEITATGSVTGLRLIGGSLQTDDNNRSVVITQNVVSVYNGVPAYIGGLWTGALFAGSEIIPAMGHFGLSADLMEMRAVNYIAFSIGRDSGVNSGQTVMYLGEKELGSSRMAMTVCADIVGYGDCTIEGALTAKGGKSRLVDTEDYSERLLYCYEMPSPMFGDIGEGVTDGSGECYIYLDDIFSETVAPGIEYQVFLQKEGPGDLWVDSKESAFFVVKGTQNLKFAWEVKVKQKGYEFERLERTGLAQESFGTNYVQQYLEEINSLIKEREEMNYEAD